MEDKSFREDLYYRLNVFPIVVPPLRERLEDIPGLAWEFIDEFSKSLGKSIYIDFEESMRQLQLYPWPGNVRELRNVIERAVILATGTRLTVTMPQRRRPGRDTGVVDAQGVSRPNTSAPRSAPRTGGSAGPGEPPIGWVSNRRRSRAASRGWGWCDQSRRASTRVGASHGQAVRNWLKRRDTGTRRSPTTRHRA